MDPGVFADNFLEKEWGLKYLFHYRIQNYLEPLFARPIFLLSKYAEKPWFKIYFNGNSFNQIIKEAIKKDFILFLKTFLEKEWAQDYLYRDFFHQIIMDTIQNAKESWDLPILSDLDQTPALKISSKNICQYMPKNLQR